MNSGGCGFTRPGYRAATPRVTPTASPGNGGAVRRGTGPRSSPLRGGAGTHRTGEGLGAVAVVAEAAEARRGRREEDDPAGARPAETRRDRGVQVRAVARARRSGRLEGRADAGA